MELVVINALLYCTTLWIYWKQNKHFNFYSLILLIYATTACLCVFNYSQTPSEWNDLGLIPFLYLFTILLIFLFPMRHFNTHRLDVQDSDSKWLRYLAYFYIIIGFVNIATSIEHTIALFNSGEWGTLRNEFYADEENVKLYENSLHKFVKNVSSYLSPFAYSYLFLLLTKEKLNKKLFIGLFIALIVPAFLSATVVASRGLIVFLVVKLLIAYLLFSNYVPKNRKKLLYLVGLFLVAIFAFYTITVTYSRFGEDEATNSLIDYFGHSMLYFNDGVFNNMHDFAWGKRFFKWFIDLFGGNSTFNIANAGATHGTAFFTFVGGIFIDWGPFFSVFVAIIGVIFISRFFKKKKLYLSDTIMIIFYVDFLANGIYAYASGRALTWIMTYIIYLIVKKLEYAK